MWMLSFRGGRTVPLKGNILDNLGRHIKYNGASMKPCLSTKKQVKQQQQKKKNKHCMSLEKLCISHDFPEREHSPGKFCITHHTGMCLKFFLTFLSPPEVHIHAVKLSSQCLYIFKSTVFLPTSQNYGFVFHDGYFS